MFYFALCLVTTGMLNLVQKLLVEAAYSVQRLGTGWTVRCSISTGGNRFFFSIPVHCGPGFHPYLLYSGHRGTFPEVKWPWRGVSHYRHLSRRFRIGKAVRLLLPSAFYREIFTFRYIYIYIYTGDFFRGTPDITMCPEVDSASPGVKAAGAFG